MEQYRSADGFIDKDDEYAALITFATEYIALFYENDGVNDDLSARDFRYAAMELGLHIDHSEALELVERINSKELQLQSQRRLNSGNFVTQYLYAMTHGQ